MGNHTTPDVAAALHVVWGKSRGGRGLLLEHLLDTAAVGELIYDEFLADSTRAVLDRVAAGGDGRRLLALLCGIHDVGKATPVFQMKDEQLAVHVEATGLRIDRPRLSRASDGGHWLTGATLTRAATREAGWAPAATDWVWPLVGGHHGRIPLPPVEDDSWALLGWTGGAGPWRELQWALLDHVVAGCGYTSLAAAEPRSLPSRAEQLAIAGIVIMADWLASDDHYRGGDLDRAVSMELSRSRARRMWSGPRLRGGWRIDSDSPAVTFSERFGFAPRPLQGMVQSAAQRMDAPGLIVVEAPMGEGKTEAALAAVEVLARRFGLSGTFFALPTQATSDPMFTRVRRWLTSFAPDTPVALLHGRRRFNREWNELSRATSISAGVDEFGVPNPYARVEVGAGQPEPVIQWLLGRHRALLTPVCIGTIDHLLWAATRTPHVALRASGLAGKVVVVDEAHASDLYMRQFLHEALRWLGSLRVPVVMLSATLPPALRRGFVDAYLEGATAGRSVTPAAETTVAGYPRLTTAWINTGEIDQQEYSCEPSLPARRMRVEFLPDASDSADDASLLALLQNRLTGGGRVLIVRNSVGRAQQTYRVLSEVFEDHVDLLHSRFTAAERSRRTESALARFGAGGDADGIHILVSTQIAEQSFDIDVDLLVTDVAPIDLLLQRIGRMHRHPSRDPHRPPGLAEPTVVVTGMTDPRTAVPTFPSASMYVYPELLLLRTAALLAEAFDSDGWSMPTDISRLVSAGYDTASITPSDWEDRVLAAQERDAAERAHREAHAAQFLLGTRGSMQEPTLAGLHHRLTPGVESEDDVAAVVRDGPETVEVMLLRRTERGLVTRSGRRLSTGHALAHDDPDAIEEAAGSVLRLPPSATASARAVPAESAFSGSPFLEGARVVAVDADGWLDITGGRGLRYRYDDRLGLVAERVGNPQ